MGAALMASPVLGAGILGGSALIGTAATVATNKSNQNFGSFESEKSRAWSSNERLAAQAYNTSEREAAQAYNTSEREAAQAYNDPRNQMKLLRAAGANPNAMANGVSFVGAQPQHSQGQSSSPGASSTPGIGTAQVPNIPQLISSGSDLVNALAKNKETEASLPLINEQVKYYIQKTFGEEINNDILALQKKVKESTLDADIKSKFEELAKLEFEKTVAQRIGEKYEAETQLIKVQKDVEGIIKSLKGEELIQAQYLTGEWHRINNAMINLQQSETSKNYAQAHESTANADQVKLFNKIYSDKRYQHSLVTQAVEAGRQAVEQTKISKSQAEHMTYLVEQAAYANDMKEFTYWSNQITQFVGTLGDAATSIYGAGSLKALTQIRRGQLQSPTSVRGFAQ